MYGFLREDLNIFLYNEMLGDNQNWTIFARSSVKVLWNWGQIDANLKVNIDCDFAGVSKSK
jgi:hypothetical protein